MVATSALLSVFLLAAATVEPAAVPARGEQVATVRVERAGMFHLSARSDHGTACQLVDHQRGPFAASGRSGHDNCALDLLLDAGVYRWRLTSPDEGEGQVRLAVVRYGERFDEPLRLERGRSDHIRLPERQQASWWLRIAERRPVELSVIGRTAGMVRLWRDGRWIEPIEQEREQLMPVPDKPLHLHRLHGVLEPGDYRLVAYGAEAASWAAGDEAEFLYVANGFAEGSAERVETFALPDWGRVAFQVPASRLAAFLELDRSPQSPVQLQVFRLEGDEGDRLGRRDAACQVDADDGVPLCSCMTGSDERHLLVVSGPPGTAGRLRWAEATSGSRLADGLYSRVRKQLEFTAPGSGEYLIAVDDVPFDPDALPLSCKLELRRPGRPDRHQADDLLRIGSERALDHSFNYDGRRASLWFRISDGGRYRFATSGERGAACELFSAEGDSLQPRESGCRFTRSLTRGVYRLVLYRGKPGIERLRIGPGGLDLPFGLSREPAAAEGQAIKNSCRFDGHALRHKQRYRIALNRGGRVSARGLVLRALPLKLAVPLPLVIDPGDAVELPLAPGAAVELRAVGGEAYQCSLGTGAGSSSRGGVCRLAATRQPARLVIRNPSENSLAVTAMRPQPKPEPAALAAHAPARRVLPEIVPGRSRHFDFERNQSHSMIFDVEQAGLYHLTTTGLLATACRVRTPIFPELAGDSQSGRGRNCLVAGMLQPGRYLLTATAQGRSRGRAGVRVERRAVRRKPGIKAAGRTFFRVAADTLVEQRIAIEQADRYRLRSSGQNVSLQCRLEDAAGWPLVRVPCRCDLTRHFEPGRLRWVQLPLTVESMRQTELERIEPPAVLSGDAPHRIPLNRPQRVALGEDGKDEFRFRLQAPLPVRIELTHGMQGRLYRLQDESWQLVVAVPPGGLQRELDPGRYRLQTEHSRADVGIRYQVALHSAVLAPGLARDGLAVPGEVDVRMPAAGVLRIGSKGETDVRCRLFDAAGELVAEGDDVGADWNCLLAVPVAAGDYKLVLEAANRLPGRTRIQVDAPAVREVGRLEHGQMLETGNRVLLAELPASDAAVIQEVGFGSKLRFSCQLEDLDGRALQRHLDVLRCGFLVHSGGAAHRVRLWTRRWSGRLEVKRQQRPLVRMDDGDIPEGRAARVPVARAGRYRTAPKVWCLPAAQRGALRYCGGEASLPAGDVLFSTTGAEREPDLEMEQLVAEVDAPLVAEVGLRDEPRWQRQRSEAPALHLLSLSVDHGEQSAPACRIDGGVNRLTPEVCFAASGLEHEVLGRWWLAEPGARRRHAQLQREAVPVPETSERLARGLHQLVWRGPSARYRLPAEPARIELLLPADAWAVQLDANGRPLDLCTPTGRLSRCVLGATGGELVLVSDAERQARARVLQVPRPPGRVRLEGLFERWPLVAGQTSLSVPPAPVERRLRVRGADGCRIALDDGTRFSACALDLPAGAGALVELSHPAGPVSAVVAREQERQRMRWGEDPSSGPARPLLAAEMAPLAGRRVERSLVLDQAAVVHLTADAGICALSGPAGGLRVVGHGRGCEIHRLLSAGVWRIAVRGFAEQKLAGSLVWTAEPVRRLHEGVGAEDWLAPGSSRIYGFRVAAEGEVGLGVRAAADLLRCRISDRSQRLLGTGCQQLLELAAGEYLLTVELPAAARPLRYRPVLLGLTGSRTSVPQEYLRDLFRRIGLEPNGGQR